MKRAFGLLSALVVLAAFAGCNNDEAKISTPQGIKSAPGVAAGWTLKLQRSCTAQTDAMCVGKSGMTVTSDGKFTVGPSTGNETYSGKLSDADLQALTAALNAPAVDTADIKLVQLPAPQNSNDLGVTATLTSQGRAATAIEKDSETQPAVAGANAEAATTLHNAILTALSDKYYEVPFPSNCMTAKRAVEAQYPALQQCQAATDCEYVTSAYGPTDYYRELDASHAQTTDIWVKSGWLVKPLVVANTVAFHAGADGLKKAFADAESTCLAEDQKLWNKTDPALWVALNPGTALPTCTNHVCSAPAPQAQ